MSAHPRAGQDVRSPGHFIEIDHIVLTGVDLAPERAPHLRALIAAEVPRMLEPGFSAAPAGAAAIAVGPLRVTGPGERPLAAGIARAVVQAVTGGGG